MENLLTRVVADQKTEVDAKQAANWCTRHEERRIDLDSPLAQVVVGVRRSGKSTLCHKVFRDRQIPYAYLNFDDERLINLKMEQLDLLLEALYRVYGDFKHLFLDEVQNIEGWHLFVNRLLRQNIHIVVTGSNAKLLGSDLASHLTGRHICIELFPFSFAEYLSYKGLEYSPLTTKGISFVKQAYEDYLKQGGFPELFQIGDTPKKSYIQTLLHSILFKDILQRFSVKYPKALGDLFYWSVENYSREINSSAIAKALGISSPHTIQNYLEYLNQAYLTLRLNKFSFQAAERLRSQKNYLVDTSFIVHGTSEMSGDNLGYQLENIVFLELMRRRSLEDYELFFFKKDYEIDFVLVFNRQVKQLIQVSYNIDAPKTRQRELNALWKASKELHCQNLLLITQSQRQSVLDEKGKVEIVPIIDWLLQAQ